MKSFIWTKWTQVDIVLVKSNLMSQPRLFTSDLLRFDHSPLIIRRSFFPSLCILGFFSLFQRKTLEFGQQEDKMKTGLDLQKRWDWTSVAPYYLLWNLSDGPRYALLSSCVVGKCLSDCRERFAAWWLGRQLSCPFDVINCVLKGKSHPSRPGHGILASLKFCFLLRFMRFHGRASSCAGEAFVDWFQTGKVGSSFFLAIWLILVSSVKNPFSGIP